MPVITGRDEEFKATITTLYREELRRDPDPGGMAAWLEQARHGMTGEQIRQALHDSAEGVAVRSKPPAPIAPKAPVFTVAGRDFVNTSGQRIVLKGYDQFRAFRMFLDGQDLDPLFKESNELGFDLWRVFLMGSVAQNGLLDLAPDGPAYYEKLRPFADLVNERGIVLLATVFVDAQDKLPARDDQRRHWNAVAEHLRGSNVLLSGGNEYHKNGFDPGDLLDPGGILWSRGSDLGDAAPFRPYGSFAEFHPRRDLPAALMDTVASPTFIYGDNKLDRPLIIDEPPRMGFEGSGDYYADPFNCWKFARHYSTECAGAVFHAKPGQRGVVMDSLTRACALAWQRGMAI